MTCITRYQVSITSVWPVHVDTHKPTQTRFAGTRCVLKLGSNQGAHGAGASEVKIVPQFSGPNVQ